MLIILFSGLAGIAQVNIGSTAAPDPNAVLELTAANKGVLLPRVALVSTSSPAPLTAFVAGMQLYNTATLNDVTPGIYYSDGTKWIKFLASMPGNSAWLKGGNGGTNPSSNYIGTSDAADFSLRTNAAEQMRITTGGNIGIGTATPAAKLHVNGDVIISNLPAGAATDSLVTVDPATGKLQSISAARINGVRKAEYTAVQGQLLFTTPAIITDIDKISFYRNGVLINCAISGPNSVTAEIACETGDNVKIIQQL